MPASSSPVRSMIQLALLVGLAYLGILVLFGSMQREMLYVPSKGPVQSGEFGLAADRLTEVQVKAADGVVLHGWLSVPEGVEGKADELVILFPGNAGHRGYRAPIIRDFNSLGAACLIVDYRGYAENEGSPSEMGFARDAQAIWEFATTELGYPADRIILCGESMGGGVATRLAWELSRKGTPPGGLILRTTFASLVETAKHHYPWLPVGAFLLDRYPSAARLPEIASPVLVIHGTNDRVVPFSQGEKLFAAAPEHSANGIPKSFLILPGADHNNVMEQARDEIQTAHEAFLKQIRESRRQAAVGEAR